MKKSERRRILFLVILVIILIIILIVRNSRSDKSGGKVVGTNGGTSVSDNGENFTTLDDGSKKNTSSKLAEVKTFGNYEISNIELTEQEGQSQILADVKNIGDSKTDFTSLNITLLDNEGKEIITITGFIGELEPGETTQLNTGATTDFADAYDIKIEVADLKPATEGSTPAANETPAE